MPHWVKINNHKIYLSKYGVASYSAETLRNAHLYSIIEKNLFGVRHEPIEVNFSHCEMYITDESHKPNKAERRAIRMALKHNCKVVIYPDREINIWRRVLYFLIMLYHRALLKIPDSES